MSAANFPACLAVILKSEGGYGVDQGGPTNCGVTIPALQAWLHRPCTAADIKALTPDGPVVGPLYRADFFNLVGCPSYAPGVDLMVFDEAVNEGPGRAIRHLQEVLKVPVDGNVGSVTLNAAQSADPITVINGLHATNSFYYTMLDSRFPQDEDGWQARNDRTWTIALQMVNAPAVQPAPPPTPTPLATVATSLPAKTAQPILTPSQIAITAGTGAVIAAGTALAQANAMHIDLSPILVPLIQLAGLVLTGIVGWAATRFAAYAHVSTQSAQFQQILGAVDRGISYGASKAQAMATQDASIDVTNAAQAQALSYVVSKMPGAMQSLGMTPQHVSDLILARLPPFTPAAVNA